jgi:glucose-fructose oxidoreductase
MRLIPDLFSRQADGTGKVRYAVVGLGWIAQAAVLPAFKNVRRSSELVALVSDDREKLDTLGRGYGVKLRVGYDRYEELLRSGEIDAVYIALPNHMHKDFTVAAARAGVHVLCEKPMAPTAADCREMITAAREAKVKLMIAYRLHFEIGNLEAIEVVQSGIIGAPRIFDSVFSQNVEAGNLRLDAAKGEDAALFDMGIYCINASRYLFQEEPTEVIAAAATRDDARFHGTGEMTSAILRFPEEKLASFTCSFGAAPHGWYEVTGTKGRILVESAYDFDTAPRHVIEVGESTSERRFKPHDQFGAELAYFSRCIHDDLEPEPSGAEGLRDVVIVEAIHRAIAQRSPVHVDLPQRARRPDVGQEIELPAVKSPKLVHARSPH